MPRDSDAVDERFNLHAAVTLDADDDVGRERRCRYLMRPAFSLSRIQMRRDGNVSYRVKKLGSGARGGDSSTDRGRETARSQGKSDEDGPQEERLLGVLGGPCRERLRGLGLRKKWARLHGPTL